MKIAAWICLLLPLASALAITIAGTRIPRRAAAYVSTLTTMGAFVAAVVAFFDMWSKAPHARAAATTSWTWLSAGQYHFGLTLLVDQLSIVMMLIVAGVGSLIIAYAVGYMDGEDEERRFFAYMSLFVFSMLLLVEGGNLLLLLAGWGMVGLSSYLLIGYYQERASAIAAAKKAFVMNAFGDATMALALFLLIKVTGRLDYAGVFAHSPHGGTTANLIALGLLGGALAKSAQLPLHTWLPDAMEGPTPVSALIHAATMVTAGVYLIVRTHVLFENAYIVQDLAAGLGAATLVMAGLIALVQTDIKRVIAYSTMSQIGYMFVGAGLGAYPNAMFHLMTHAFFKALLFLAAGIAIHAVTGEQDIRKLAGVGKLMPFTKIVFLIGSLALVGIFPFAGFFSKDSIIAAALAHGTYGAIIWVACIVGAFLTGVYAFRLYFIVFTGEPSAFAREHFHAHHDKEGPLSMLWTVGTLAVLALVGGFLQFAPVWHPLTDWLAPVAAPITDPSNTQEWITSGFALAVGLAGIGVAYVLYVARTVPVPKALPLFEKKFYWDELYDVLWYRTADAFSRMLGTVIEVPLVAGAISAMAGLAGASSRELSVAQSGLVRTYALFLAGGLAILTLVFLAAR
ncbi:MAG TPA: NADH-quinone oxidoreductase subunit L [Gaiellaceae bacterium]|jgi:NADH-quinone oxidoreductase subunit L|nr:NADH-quinone oxidoreductase subunit L [Gaiellaceae bacterium]